MLLRNSISNTKKFFQKTLQSFKSFFSAGAIDYQKIPKTSPYSPYSFSDMNAQTSHQQDLEKFYADFTHRWDSEEGGDKHHAKKRSKPKILTEEPKEGNEVSFRQLSRKVEKREEDSLYSKISKKKREGRSLSVAEKLKELEMMDMSNVDHVLDIEEVLHYYSRLTCPAYLDIVDKFFMDMYTEFLGPPASPKSVNSRPKFRSVRA